MYGFNSYGSQDVSDFWVEKVELVQSPTRVQGNNNP